MLSSPSPFFARFSEHRPFSVIALFQMFVILLGWMLTAWELKSMGYPNSSFRWNPTAVFVRDWGPFFILLPPLWVVAALYLDDRFSSNTPRWVWLGTGLVILLSLGLVLWSTITYPGHVPLRTFRP